MADDFDTCVGLKRRISDIGESSGSASTIAKEVVEQAPVLVSSPKQDQDLIDEETTKILVSDFVPKKPKSVEDEKVTKESANPPVASDDCLEVKKKQLLQELEAMVMPGQEVIDGSLGIQVIDETALIDSIPFSKFSKNKTESEEKKAKRSRRKAKGTKIVEVHSGFPNNGERTKIVEVHSGFSNNGERTKIVYSREAMEALRFVNVVEQKKMWKDLYIGLGPAVRKEYDGLVNSKHHKNTHFNFDNKQRFGKKEDSSVMLVSGEQACSESMENELVDLVKNYAEDGSPLDANWSYNVKNEDSFEAVEEYDEDEDIEEDYASIQRPAFLVEGEPNFDAGPPEDGLEYLKRVRWEAAQIPKVRVAKVDRSKFNKEQSEYMPKVPDIAKCPEHLQPLKQWEDAFLADFSELRLALSRLDSSSIQNSSDLQSKTVIEKSSEKIELPRVTIGEISEDSENLTRKSSVNENCSKYPLLSVILGMDSVGRVSMLRKRISSLDGMSSLSKEECLWLFALCAVVDTPLDADTCASLRTLLRKSASLVASKSQLDDEVVMLNILVTISGRFFRQLES